MSLAGASLQKKLPKFFELNPLIGIIKFASLHLTIYEIKIKYNLQGRLVGFPVPGRTGKGGRLIQSCQLPSSLIGKLALTFFKSKTRKYGTVSFDYGTSLSQRKETSTAVLFRI